ncbi:MAG: type II toxin-antitoxin system VapC family toxin [Candidatus Omnitrophica bacterium]|nr:type II toxin-antitoxin system VapC family toxin [Candidatus Omnitrophota bacterium]
MRLFIDTSSLFKKYVDESGSAAFERLLSKAVEIAVSPVTWIEMNAAIERCLRDNILTSEKAEWLRVEAKKDFAYFLLVVWNENLEKKAVQLIHQYALKTMDAVQLAAGILSNAEIFVTSDHQLHRAAKKVMRRVRFV